MLFLDLHRCTVEEALVRLAREYNANLTREPPQDLDVIHGQGRAPGGGRIRKVLRRFLKAHGHAIGYCLGENLDRNPGHTVLHPLSLARLEVQHYPYPGLRLLPPPGVKTSLRVPIVLPSILPLEERILALCGGRGHLIEELVDQLGSNHAMIQAALERLTTERRIERVRIRGRSYYFPVLRPELEIDLPSVEDMEKL